MNKKITAILNLPLFSKLLLQVLFLHQEMPFPLHLQLALFSLGKKLQVKI